MLVDEKWQKQTFGHSVFTQKIAPVDFWNSMTSVISFFSFAHYDNFTITQHLKLPFCRSAILRFHSTPFKKSISFHFLLLTSANVWKFWESFGIEFLRKNRLKLHTGTKIRFFDENLRKLETLNFRAKMIFFLEVKNWTFAHKIHVLISKIQFESFSQRA